MSYRSGIVQLLHLTPAIGVGAGIGLATGPVSPWLLLSLIAAGVGMYVLLAIPELALLLVLVGYATILDTDVVPYFGAGGISLNVLDLVLIALLAKIALRRLLRTDSEIRLTPVGLAMAAFMVVAVASIALGLLRGTTTLNLATTELRYLGYYLIYFAVVYLIRDAGRLRLLLAGGLFLSIATAAAMIVQFVVGPSVPILAGRVEQFAQDGARALDVARILPPGRYLVLTAFILLTVTICLRGLGKRRVFTLLAWLVLALAVLLTFNRNFWLSSVVALTLFSFVANAIERRNLAALIGITAIVGGSVIAGIAAALPDARIAGLASSLGERMLSIVDSSTYTASNDENLAVSSLSFRRIETNYALEHVWPPTALGLGVGAQYRPTLPYLDWEGFDGRGYIHNGHLWVLLKTGVLGYITLVGMMVMTIVRGMRVWRYVRPGLQPVAIGVPLVVVAVLLSSLVDPIITDLTWAPLFGVLAGSLDVIVQGVNPPAVPVARQTGFIAEPNPESAS